ncbi:PLP-dependent transferase [Acephala macrosclerotiorum]|nr:PLP-dependent transferase [Acephala macrosclerotiorum]
MKNEHITVLNGVCSVIDALAFCIAQPIYTGFLGDFEDRAGVKVVPVAMKGVDIVSLEAVGRYEEALLKTREEGIEVKSLLLCNPPNPLWKCYERDVLVGYLRLCDKYKIHLISDEFYAHSIYPTKPNPNPQPLLSILSLPYEEFINPSLVLYIWSME